MKTAKLRDEKEVLDRQQHVDIEAQKNLEENLQQLRNRSSELDLQEEQMESQGFVEEWVEQIPVWTNFQTLLGQENSAD